MKPLIYRYISHSNGKDVDKWLMKRRIYVAEYHWSGHQNILVSEVVETTAHGAKIKARKLYEKFVEANPDIDIVKQTDLCFGWTIA